MSNSSASILNLDELLDKLGFTQWQTTMASFILPVVNLVGLSFCSLSAWIFFRPKFTDPIYFYYRLLCLVYILHLVHNFFYGLFFSPRYLTQINTYLSSLYHIYYFLAALCFFLFEELLQIGILLSRMTFFSPFLARHLKVTPKTISFIFLIACFLINFPFFFSLKIIPLELYYVVDSHGVKQTSMFHSFTSGDYYVTSFRKAFIEFYFFLNLTVTFIAGISLNIFSILKYRTYTKQRRYEFEEHEMTSIHNRPVTCREMEQISQREKCERHIEKNMLYMAITFCSASIASRVLLMVSNIYFHFYYSIMATLSLMIIVHTIYTLVPTVAIFIFYSFNQMFREELRSMFFRKRFDSQNFGETGSFLF